MSTGAMAGVCSLQAMAAASSVSRLGASRNGVSSSSSSSSVAELKFAPLGMVSMKNNRVGVQTVCQAAAASGRVPDLAKRQTMNLLLLGAISLPAAGLLGPFLYFLVPPSSGGGGAGVNAKDALGNDVTLTGWLKTHGPGDRTLAQGLRGDPTYLVVENDGTLASFGVNAVCTHLGCVVPFNGPENKFICPCHGSQYNNQGRVVRGPAPLSLALAHVDVVDDKVVFSPWPETDFRTGEEPWWA